MQIREMNGKPVRLKEGADLTITPSIDSLANRNDFWESRRNNKEPSKWIGGLDKDQKTALKLVSVQTETPLGSPSPNREMTLKNPTLIENAVISASVITTGNCHLWAPSVFILSAPKKCVLEAKMDDMGVKNEVGKKHDLEK